MEKVNNEQILQRIGEKRTLLNNILRRKANWIGPSGIYLTAEENLATETVR